MSTAGERYDLVVRDATVWSRGHWIPHRDVLVTDGRTAGLPEHRPIAIPARVTVEGAGRHVLPGFVNTHTHLFQALLRGCADGLALREWLFVITRAAIALDPERAYAAAAAAAVELLRSGTTTVVDHMWPHPDRDVNAAIIRALEDSGVRAVFCRGVVDRVDPSRRWGFEPRLVEPLDDQLAHVEELVARQAGSRVRIGLAPPNPRVLTVEAMRAVRELAERHDLCVSVHLLETPLDEEAYREHERSGVVEFLDGHDFLWDRFLAVHCVNVAEQDRRTMAARGVGVSYNPASNMRLGSGIAPVPELLAEGAPVGIGVDGAASNDTQDMIETLRIGAYLQRARLRDPSVLTAADMLAMATNGANATVGIEERPAGVAVGMQADLVVLDFLADLATVPVVDPGATLLLQASSRAVETVIVDGEVVIAGGRSTRLDEERLIRDVQRLRYPPSGAPVADRQSTP